ncbi:nucleoside recognition family protein [Mycobacterium xenopi 4042]|uniref:Nucleoside recognition family protein n=1 Tax=Mycobacterium xenopi 4042 TaxID=1299334 RepID=X8DZM9_MYCXE|nr:nucleoside recognition family protein [Mycobacterium xenopi 4042]
MLGASNYVAPQPDHRTNRIDRLLLHPLWGTVVFFAVMFAFFQVVFTIGAPLRDGIADGLNWLGTQLTEHMGNSMVGSLLGHGVIGGVGTVLQFLPQIVLLFLLIALLENIGYMARAAFVMDRVMATTGLEGRAFVAMLSSFACAIPGIMATRTLPSSRDRIATILSAPLMTCSARLPVYTLLVGLLVAPKRVGGAQRPGHHDVLAVSRRRHFSAGRGLAVQVDNPAQRSAAVHYGASAVSVPSPKSCVGRGLECGKRVLAQGRNHHLDRVTGAVALLNLPAREAETATMSRTDATAYVMSHSYAADVGKGIEPVFKPLGFDWHIDVALVGALSAREVFVSTLGQVSAATDPANPGQALATMTDDRATRCSPHRQSSHCWCISCSHCSACRRWP